MHVDIWTFRLNHLAQRIIGDSQSLESNKYVIQFFVKSNHHLKIQFSKIGNNVPSQLSG